MQAIRDLISNLVVGVGITDVLDVAIVAFIIYKLLGIIQKSRASAIIKGVIVLIVIALVSAGLNLYTLNWIIKMVFEVGILALVVIFQPELRRALEHVGRGHFFKSTRGDMDQTRASDLAAEFVKAMTDMSESKTGALIVFEKQMALKDVYETGKIIDSEISAQLIENIFYKGSPLHDGALIVKGDKLYAAACVLPLTKNNTLPLILGTRHRAGIGITERSDCLTFIVSEETGEISIAEDGVISRNIDGGTIEQILVDHYTGEDKNSVIENIGERINRAKKNGGDD